MSWCIEKDRIMNSCLWSIGSSNKNCFGLNVWAEWYALILKLRQNVLRYGVNDYTNSRTYVLELMNSYTVSLTWRLHGTVMTMFKSLKSSMMFLEAISNQMFEAYTNEPGILWSLVFVNSEICYFFVILYIVNSVSIWTPKAEDLLFYIRIKSSKSYERQR